MTKVRDMSSYVWALWWMAHQVAHLGDPWFTTYMAAPVGVQLGFDTLMPLPGLIMTPVTLLFGPSASRSPAHHRHPGAAVLRDVPRGPAVARPGRRHRRRGVLRPVQHDDLAGLYHLNITLGTLFLPLTLEAAVRLRRPGRARASSWAWSSAAAC